MKRVIRITEGDIKMITKKVINEMFSHNSDDSQVIDGEINNTIEDDD